MSAQETKRECAAAWVLGGWLLLHQFLTGDAGLISPVLILLLIAGLLLRIFGVFPPVLAWRLLLVGAVVFSLAVFKPTAVVAGAVSGLLGAVVLLRPLAPRRGRWILLCAMTVLASITLQESGTVNAVFVVADVAVLMFLAQQIHAPPEADPGMWASVLRSLRLILPVALIVTVFFWLFPAISTHANVAFVRFAGGDLLSPGEASEIRLTRRIAFVATFPQSSAVPSFSNLYWRGQVLENNEGLRWSVDPARINSGTARRGSLSEAGEWRYFQRLGPDRVLAALDRPVSVVAFTGGATVLETGASAYSVLGTGEVELVISSASIPANDPPRPDIASASLDVPAKIRNDLRLRFLASTLFTPGATLSNDLDSLGHFFASGGYSYTLRPGKMPSGRVAWFLFEHRKGFCGHYAAAAANILRVGGIPSRIVTGFRGGTWNPWLRTLTLRDSDAHAWVEAWDEKAGNWIRFDPTSFIAPELSAVMEVERNPDRWPWFRLAAAYAVTQNTLTAERLESALSTHFHPALWTVVVAIAGMAVAARWISNRRKSQPDLAATCLAKLEKSAALRNRSRLCGETPLAWLARLETLSPSGADAPEIRKFAASYESFVYAQDGRSREPSAALKSASRQLARIWRMRL